jgi:hypothetical protein
VPEYVYSISDTSVTITFMETAPPDMAPICAPSTSVTNSQKGPSLTTLNTSLPSDTFGDQSSTKITKEIFNFKKSTL